MRRETQEQLVKTGKIEGKCGMEKQVEKMLDGLKSG